MGGYRKVESPALRRQPISHGRAWPQALGDFLDVRNHLPHGRGEGMKRSEMIEVIDEVLYEYDLPLLQGISKHILAVIERKGMLPPSVKLKSPESAGNNLVWHKNEWEPENE